MSNLVASPCVGICNIDEASGYCRGCARTRQEVTDWRSLPAGARQAVWDALPERFERLDVTIRRLPWTTAAICEFVEHTLRAGAGTWVLGVPGAIGEFTIGASEAATIRTDSTVVEAVTARAALRFRFSSGLRAFEAVGGRPVAERPVILGLHHTSLPDIPRHEVLVALGPDTDAIEARDKVASLFDIGLGRQNIRFCVRTADPDLIEALTSHIGNSPFDVLDTLGAKLIEAGPVRVIETGLGRMEIRTSIPTPGSQSPDGPHTHLSPKYLATGHDLPAGMELPPYFTAGAIFYPMSPK